jgi:ATP-binding cassette subfamily B multidrug efflux pump
MIKKIKLVPAILIIAGVVLAIISSAVAGVMLDQIIKEGPSTQTVQIIVVVLLVLIMSQGIDYIQENIINQVVQKDAIEIEENFLDQEIDKKNNKINNSTKYSKVDSEVVENNGIKLSYKIFQAVVTIITVTLYLIIQSVPIFLAVTILNLILVTYMLKGKNKLEEKTVKMSQEKNNLLDYVGYLENSYSAISRIATKEFIMKIYNQKASIYRNAKYELSKEANRVTIKNGLVSNVINIITLIVLAFATYNKTIEFGKFFAIITILHPNITSMITIAQSIPGIKKAESLLNEFDSQINQIQPKSEFTKDANDFALKNQDKTYNFSVNQKTLITGKSGSGKSTLIANLLNPTNYELTVDGNQLNNVVAPNNIVILTNEKYILKDLDIYENIKMGRTISNEQVDEYLTKYNLDHLKNRKTINSDELSQGEKQRIEIIRCIINNPRILILDEAFNNLDSKTKKIVQDDIYSSFSSIIEISHDAQDTTKYDQHIKL